MESRSSLRDELSGCLDQRLDSYSHGMRRKVDLMTAVFAFPTSW